MENITFDHFKTAIVLTIIWTGFVGLFVLLQGWEKKLTRYFGIYNLLLCSWSIGWLLHVYAPDASAATFWAQVLHVSCSLFPAVFYHFSQHFLNNHSRWGTRTCVLFYTIGVIFSFLSLGSELLITGAMPRANMPFYPIRGTLYNYFVAYFFLAHLFALYQFWIRQRRLKGQEKTNASIVFWAYLFGYSVSIYAFFPLYDRPIPQYALYAIPLTQMVIFYSILKYNLMNFRHFLKRAGLLIIIYLILIASVIPFIAGFHQINLGITRADNIYLIFEIMLISLILSLAPFLYAYFVQKSSFFHQETVASLTHELKSPLATIENTLEILSETEKSNLKGIQKKEYMDILKRNSDRLRNLVEDLLETMKKNEKGSDLDLKRVDIVALIREVLRPYEEMVKMKGVDIILKSNPSYIEINCDADKIKKALSNILSNAAKFTAKGVIKIEINQKEGKVKISVKDSGKGIPSKELPHIFERFFKGRSDKSSKGTGIGLTLAKSWIEAHGGEISVDSAGESKGTLVSLIIPMG